MTDRPRPDQPDPQRLGPRGRHPRRGVSQLLDRSGSARSNSPRTTTTATRNSRSTMPARGLHRMVRDIASSTIRNLASYGVEFDSGFLNTLTAAYRRMAQDAIASYSDDAHAERAGVRSARRGARRRDLLRCAARRRSGLRARADGRAPDSRTGIAWLPRFPSFSTSCATPSRPTPPSPEAAGPGWRWARFAPSRAGRSRRRWCAIYNHYVRETPVTFDTRAVRRSKHADANGSPSSAETGPLSAAGPRGRERGGARLRPQRPPSSQARLRRVRSRRRSTSTPTSRRARCGAIRLYTRAAGCVCEAEPAVHRAFAGVTTAECRRRSLCTRGSGIHPGGRVPRDRLEVRTLLGRGVVRA